jgi:hypothetical protein
MNSGGLSSTAPGLCAIKGSRVSESKHCGNNAGHIRTITSCRIAEHQLAVDAAITVAHRIALGDTA